MTGRRQIFVTLVALLALGVVASPAHAAAGGASPDVLTLPGAPQIVVRIGNPLVEASSDGIVLRARATALLRGRSQLTGNVSRQTPGSVQIERLDPRLGWVAILDADVAADGTFSATWRPDRVGGLQLRAVPGASSATSANGDAAPDASAPQLDVTVYRPGVASWYGPTAKEATTACGEPLTRTTLGVAHRTLPCGTPVAFYYKGRTLVVPVIDRGPFIDGRSWDLTHAAYRALGGGGEGLVTLGALPLTPVPAAPPAQPARN
jgi:hypothetical protein